MSEESGFVPYEVAMQVVGNVVEEEHPRELNRRILTVYDKEGVEMCWYDADEIRAEAKPEKPKDQDSVKTACVEVIMRQIPIWSVEEIVKRKKEAEARKIDGKCDGDCST